MNLRAVGASMFFIPKHFDKYIIQNCWRDQVRMMLSEQVTQYV